VTSAIQLLSIAAPTAQPVNIPLSHPSASSTSFSSILDSQQTTAAISDSAVSVANPEQAVPTENTKVAESSTTKPHPRGGTHEAKTGENKLEKKGSQDDRDPSFAEQNQLLMPMAQRAEPQRSEKAVKAESIGPELQDKQARTTNFTGEPSVAVDSPANANTLANLSAGKTIAKSAPGSPESTKTQQLSDSEPVKTETAVAGPVTAQGELKTLAAAALDSVSRNSQDAASANTQIQNPHAGVEPAAGDQTSGSAEIAVVETMSQQAGANPLAVEIMAIAGQSADANAKVPVSGITKAAQSSNSSHINASLKSAKSLSADARSVPAADASPVIADKGSFLTLPDKGDSHPEALVSAQTTSAHSMPGSNGGHSTSTPDGSMPSVGIGALASAAVAGDASKPPTLKDLSTGNTQQSTAAELSAQIRANQTSQVNGMVESARLVQKVNQAEMRLNVQTPEFGRVDIQTSLSNKVFAASIHVERDGALPVLAAELPALQMRLSENHGVQPNISLSSGTNSGGESGQQQRHTTPQPYSSTAASGSLPSDPAPTSIWSSNSLLDVHA
jgi:Flagellar hook-length control protein FliK